MLNIPSPLSGIPSPLSRGGAFSVRSVLFSNNEPGSWYDPSDLTTMFQDRAGSTPVTAAGQTVGLVLDKSRGLMLGNDIAVNGGFDSDTVWTKAAGVTITGGVAVFSAVASGVGLTQTIGSVVTGRAYRIRATISNYSSGSLLCRLSSGSFISLGSANGTTDVVVFAGGTILQVFSGTAGSTFNVDNISVRELPGNHMQANSDAARGTYGIEPAGGRRNLLTYTEQFDNAAWQKIQSSITANAAVAPDGTTTADKFIPTNTTPQLEQIKTVTASSIVSGGCYFKASEKGFGYIQINGLTGGTTRASFVSIDLATGAVGSITALAGGGLVSPSASAVDAGSGWWRLNLSGGIGASNTVATLYVGLSDAQNSRTATVSGSDGILVWGAQLELAASATAYQRVVTAAEVTEAGVASVSYILFDGSDDGYVTPTITPGTDKVQVFAGVRKLSDAAAGMVFDLGNISTGSVTLQSPASAADNHQFASSGTVGANATASGFASPITNVLTGTADIAGDFVRLRVNGTQVAEALTDQGTGNYLAGLAYIGRRAATSRPFNGRIYSLIVRFGANLTTDRIAQVERYVAQKTGVTL